MIWRDRARRNLARIGGRSAPAGDELSSTEREIARLVALGRSNKQVADQLHLSVKTVEWNLSKIYRKVGVRSRTELIARAVEQTWGCLRVTLWPVCPYPSTRDIDLSRSPRRQGDRAPRVVPRRAVPARHRHRRAAPRYERLADAAAAITADGVYVRFAGASFVRSDESCFCRFESESIDAVRAACQRAQFPYDRILPVDEVDASAGGSSSDSPVREGAIAILEDVGPPAGR